LKCQIVVSQNRRFSSRMSAVRSHYSLRQRLTRSIDDRRAARTAGEGDRGSAVLQDRPGDGVLRLTISNPAKRNALDHRILDGIAAALASCDARCVILTGAGGTFCSGYDIGGIPDDDFAHEAEKLVAHPHNAALEALDAFDRPTVAACGGHTIGGGLELALACDMRIVADDVRLGMPPSKLGLIYSHTGVRRFIDTIGAARTRELFLLGREIDARVALEWGLVNRVVERSAVQDTALGLALELAANAPLSVRGNKRVIRAVLDAGRELDPAVEQELVMLRRACMESADFHEGVRAFTEKRAARWEGR
jgi:enoyl-CoA hydratase/carnithine racemase